MREETDGQKDQYARDNVDDQVQKTDADASEKGKSSDFQAEMEQQHGKTEHGQHSACDQADGAVGDAVGKAGGDQGAHGGDRHAQQQDIPFFKENGRMDQDVADGGNECGKGHDEGARADGGLQVHAEEDGKDHQHHHAPAGADKAGSKTDREAEEERNQDAFPVQCGAFGRRIFPGGIGLDEKADADGKRQKKRKSAQDHIPREIGRPAAHRAHGQDADKHDPAASEVNVFVPGIGPCGDGGPENVRGERDSGRLIGAGFPGKGRAEDNEDRDHDRGGGEPGQPCADAGADGCDEIPDIFHVPASPERVGS